MADFPAHTKVAIIGAGPVGLTLALALARRDIPSVVIERKTELDPHSRAIAMFPRTLEILRSLGQLEAILAAGERTSHLRLRRGSTRETLIDLDFNAYDGITQRNYCLAIPQDRTERILLDAAQAEPRITVAMGCTFERFEAQADDVLLHLRHADGRDGVLRSYFLIGADGAHSAVREQLGWQLEGKTYATRALLADVEVSEEADTAESWLAEPDRAVLLMSIRYAPRTWRLIEQGVPDNLADADLANHARDLTEALFGPDSWRRTIWTSVYRKHERLAPKFQAGRVVLAGDAAHLNSPAGGQGLNTGIRDAFNLAWKLDAILARRGSREALLQSYEVEQRDAFRNAVKPLTDVSEKIQTAPKWLRKFVFAHIGLGRSLGIMEGGSPAFHAVRRLWCFADPLRQGRSCRAADARPRHAERPTPRPDRPLGDDPRACRNTCGAAGGGGGGRTRPAGRHPATVAGRAGVR